MHDDAYIGGRSENNMKCVVHDDLGWKNRTTRYILPRHWLYEWFSQFHKLWNVFSSFTKPVICSVLRSAAFRNNSTLAIHVFLKLFSSLLILLLTLVNNNNNNNKTSLGNRYRGFKKIIIATMIFIVLSSWPKSLREFTRLIWWM